MVISRGSVLGKTVSSNENIRLTGWLKEKRLEKGYTMRSFAQVLGAPHTFVGKIENCERRLDVVEFVKYCKALEVDPKDGIDALGD
ncbi:MAG: transcriptional regulator with XRE-family HTH domain [Phenylobacterium sp.]|jgi:transcriptional regulator with XRE-family HTH domain